MIVRNIFKVYVPYFVFFCSFLFISLLSPNGCIVTLSWLHKSSTGGEIADDFPVRCNKSVYYAIGTEILLLFEIQMRIPTFK